MDSLLVKVCCKWGKILSSGLLIIILLNPEHAFCQELLKSSLYHDNNIDKNFVNPPSYARPRVFWWWLNSMATKESITRDLEELKAKGFGGALIFDAGSSNYEVAKKTAHGPDFGSPEWIELFLYSLKEAKRLGLEISLNIVSGWNPGGPSVTPDEALKKVTWSEQIVQGGTEIKLNLPKPSGKNYKDIVIQAFPYTGAEKKYLANWELKTLNARFKGFDEYPLYKLREENDSLIDDYDVKYDSVINLSHFFINDTLNWNVPPGKWKILRIGHCLTEARVSTASDNYTGLSFDHLSAEAFNNFFNEAVEPLIESAKEFIGNTLKYIMTDSWEMGTVNWTENFQKEFLNRRGYDPVQYLPVLTGQIVENRDVSNRFLYDFRKTVSDCIADNTYMQLAKRAHDKGLLVHPESGGPHAAPIDGLKCLGRNDFPMGEFWAKSNTHRFTEDHRFFLKQSASAAHIYGKRFVAGEGPTSIGPHWERSPKDLKSDFDRNLCEGINRFFWHCFTSSPKEFGLPGNEYFAGTHLNPNTTWWNQSEDFINYLSRSSYLLSQGLFAADVCFYYGDDIPVFAKRKKINPEIGFGYDYDECNAEVILNRMSVKDGKIILPDGMSYNILRLPDRDAISLNLLQKLEQLVKDGAVICGPKPVKAAGLSDYPASDEEVKQIAEKLWGSCDGKTIFRNNYGRGEVYWGKPLKDILAEKNILPDFDFISSQDSTQLDYIHRKTDNADIYLVVNRLARYGIYDTRYRYFTDLPDRSEQVDCKFRITGKVPEIWNAQTGKIEKTGLYREENGYTIVSLYLPPEGSVFVVFRESAQNLHCTSLKENNRQLFPVTTAKPQLLPQYRLYNSGEDLILESFCDGKYDLQLSDGRSITKDINKTGERVISGPWNVYFPPGWGAPGSIRLDSLISWTEYPHDGVKYFSGTADYINKFTLSKEQLHNRRVYLDPGNIQEIAEVYINGESAGTCWTPPYILDITSFVKEGANDITISVTNLWPNRLIGDQLLPAEKRYTKTNIEKFKSGDPLRISGLLGPVKIILPVVTKIR